MTRKTAAFDSGADGPWPGPAPPWPPTRCMWPTGADTVSVLDAASFKTLASVRVGKAPHNVQVSPDGKVVWVTNNGEPAQTADASEHKEMAQGSHDAMGKPGAVWAIDTATNAVVGKVPVGMHPAHVVCPTAASPTSPTATTTRSGDRHGADLVATIPVGKFPTVFASVRTASRPTSPTSRAERCGHRYRQPEGDRASSCGKGRPRGFTPDGSCLVSLSEETRSP